ACALVGGSVNPPIFCWGDNEWGQLGDGTTNSSPNPVQVAGFSNLTKMFVGAGQNCGIRGDGLLFCWGAGTTGQIGDGGLSHRLAPTLVRGVTGIVDVALGSGPGCAW